MACFIEITLQFIYFSQYCRGVLPCLKWHFLPSQIDIEVVVNIVCLSLVAPEEKQQHGEPNVSWHQEVFQTGPDIRRGKSHRSGPGTACQQVHQSINWLSPYHSIPGLILHADGCDAIVLKKCRTSSCPACNSIWPLIASSQWYYWQRLPSIQLNQFPLVRWSVKVMQSTWPLKSTTAEC